MLTTLGVGIAKVLPLLLCICWASASARFTGHVQAEMETIQKLAVIRQKILHSLGITDTIVANKAIPSPQTTPSTSLRVNEPLYKRIDIRSFPSESPENTTNDNIIQFKLQNIANDKSLQIDSVDLLIRVKYKKKKNNRKPRDLQSLQRPDSTSSLKNNTTTTKLSKSERKLRKKLRKREKYLDISLLVSKVKQDETPGDVITSVTSRLKKTKNLKIALPKEVIGESLRFNNSENMLKFYLQCKGCGRKASLILVHKRKKKSKRLHSTMNSNKYLHKRRPILFVKSEVTSSFRP